MDDYFSFERKIGSMLLGPYFEKHNLNLNHKTVLDVGCGYGGVLQGLLDMFPAMNGIGIDSDPIMVEKGSPRLGPTIHLENQNFFDYSANSFDIIIMRDVLEHIVHFREAMSKATDLLLPGGHLYVTFAPFNGPFGGHQQNGTGFFSRIPWLQVLPENRFLKILGIRGNKYKVEEQLILDMKSVLNTRLTVKKFKHTYKDLPLQIKETNHFLFRPEYRFKFGLPQVRLPGFFHFTEVFCTGIEVLLKKL